MGARRRARGLVETTAQFRADAIKVANVWNTLNDPTDPARVGETSFSGRTKLLLLLQEATAGGKFDDRVPDLQAAYGKVNRSNVLSAVEKLTKTYGVMWQEDYQWLCNVVHPSVATTSHFHPPPFATTPPPTCTCGSRVVRWMRPAQPVRCVGIIETTLVRSAARSARALLATADDALRVLDDVALTSRAAEIATFAYWRNVAVRDTQPLCPCLSGKRAYRCGEHQFGQPGPTLRGLPGDQPT